MVLLLKLNPFSLIIEQDKISAIYDNRYDSKVDITDGTGRFGSLTYTLLTDDITNTDKPPFVPYNTRIASYENYYNQGETIILENRTHLVNLTVTSRPDRLIFDQLCQSNELSACGLLLSLNFMSTKNGDWRSQLLVSSPYHTKDKKHFMHFFTRPDGNHLVFILENDIDGYRINYSPYLSGHYIRGFELLSQFDRAYGRTSREEKRVRVHIIPVQSYQEAMLHASEVWGISALCYDSSSVKVGQPFSFNSIGNVEKIIIKSPSDKKSVIEGTDFIPEEYGIYTAVPYDNNEAGMDCSFFVWDDFEQMHKRACNSIKQDRSNMIGHTSDGIPVWKPTHLFYRNYEDYNLCEHGMWCWSLLRYLRISGSNDLISAEARNYLNIIMAEKGGVLLTACSILAEEQYKTHNSTRIQEVYNGVNILLDAYRVFREEKYLNFAIKVLKTRLISDMGEDGGIYRHGSDGDTETTVDYTTVTCMVIPIVDMACFLESSGDERYIFYKDAAVKIADFVTNRGFSFPTEGGRHPDVSNEMEEGSMSCSALTVLYVARHIICKNEYLDFAREVLDMHDAYTVYTHHPIMFCSSLRWWETIWEGDSDGPSVCFGHSWSLWRAEAQFLYGLLCFDDERIFDAYNGFMGNYAKEDKDGNFYAVYQYEQISSGAVAANGREIDFSNREGFPDRYDSTLSRYLFARNYECFYQIAAIVNINGKQQCCGCHIKGETFVIDAPIFNTLYLGNIAGSIKIKCKESPRIISQRHYRFVDTNDSFIEIEIDSFTN